MTAIERRAEIMRILTARRKETTARLAAELNVSQRTIFRDIETLTLDYPIEAQRGIGGYVKVSDWYHPYRSIFSRDQEEVLSQLLSTGDEHQATVLRQLLAEYGSPKMRAQMR